MSTKVKVPYFWQSAYEQATVLSKLTNKEISPLARQIVKDTLEARYPGYNFMWRIDVGDEHHVTLLFDDPKEAVRFKLSHG